jgi:integrase
MGHEDYSMLVDVYGRGMDSESEKKSDFIWQELQKKVQFAPPLP